MEATTPLLATIALWTCLVGAIVLGLSMVYLGLISFFSGYANSDSWRRIARDLEKECDCLNQQNKALSYHLHRLKEEIETQNKG
jgi:hypothetical protein